ncbi:hypothetical protein VFPBJ_09773 [Purpureocillium lilacinum]|uniref:Uncharacterized protein n=1 Tax=Purpureocillium lilacinum TaxID=33203 RepID=A0A179GAC8_PURLI|nr:hypothetical protein VFPBJ_09773 [Purpureocillium lilacinum]
MSTSPLTHFTCTSARRSEPDRADLSSSGSLGHGVLQGHTFCHRTNGEDTRLGGGTDPSWGNPSHSQVVSVERSGLHERRLTDQRHEISGQASCWSHEEIRALMESFLAAIGSHCRSSSMKPHWPGVSPGCICACLLTLDPPFDHKES